MQILRKIKTLAVFALFLGGVYLVFFGIKRLFLPPATFPVPYRVTIDSGQSLFSISKEISSDGAIQSKRLFEMLVMTFGSDSQISAGEYYFEKPVSVVEVAMRIAGRSFGIEKKKVTFPEGFSNKEMASRLGSSIENFDTELFLSLTKDQQGYLFPDTYGFFPGVTPDVVVLVLKKNFQKKIQPLQKDITISGRSLSDIVIMASIIEKEASGASDRSIVSGILWNRINAGIPLQVDAPFLYLFGKESSELTKTDLATKSPYNTYVYKGLTPTPINNPGIAAISAAIYPEVSSYFYYLHDKNGNIYYAKTYTEHKQNIKKYLK
jgi:UPF0755 protein